MHMVVVKSRHEGGVERDQEMQNFIDVYMVLVSNIKDKVYIHQHHFLLHTII